MTPRSGDRVLIRPIQREDKDGLHDGFERLTPESRYRRFFSPMNELGARQVHYLTEVDHHTHEALIAIDPSSGERLGVARFVRSSTDPRVTMPASGPGGLRYDRWGHGHLGVSRTGRRPRRCRAARGAGARR